MSFQKIIYKLSREGRLPAFRIGKEHYLQFHRKDLDKALCPVEEMAKAD